MTLTWNGAFEFHRRYSSTLVRVWMPASVYVWVRSRVDASTAPRRRSVPQLIVPRCRRCRGSPPRTGGPRLAVVARTRRCHSSPVVGDISLIGAAAAWGTLGNGIDGGALASSAKVSVLPPVSLTPPVKNCGIRVLKVAAGFEAAVGCALQIVTQRRRYHSAARTVGLSGETGRRCSRRRSCSSTEMTFPVADYQSAGVRGGCPAVVGRDVESRDRDGARTYTRVALPHQLKIPPPPPRAVFPTIVVLSTVSCGGGPGCAL